MKTWITILFFAAVLSACESVQWTEEEYAVERRKPADQAFAEWPELRRIYLEAYVEGVAEGVQNDIRIICFFPTNPEEHAHAAGYDAGRFEVVGVRTEMEKKAMAERMEMTQLLMKALDESNEDQ